MLTPWNIMHPLSVLEAARASAHYGSVLYHPKHLLCNVLDWHFEFPRFKSPKTQRCKTLILNMFPHLHSPERPVRREVSDAKVQI